MSRSDAQIWRITSLASVVYAGLIAISVIWLMAIYTAPWLVARGYVLTGTFVYAIFTPICHQRPERSFYFDGLPLAVCARCLGIYAGFLGGLLVYPLWRRLDDEEMPARRWLLASLLPMFVDLAGDRVGLFVNTHISRVATGAVTGAALAFYLLPGLVSTFSAWLLTAKYREDS
jgi:uncharacterized membrane protein